MAKRLSIESKQDLSNLLGTSVKNKAADIILSVLDSDHEKQHKTNHKKHHRIRTGSTQDMVPIRNIKNGIITTQDGRRLFIIEVLPVNYYMKKGSAQKMILASFSNLFRTNPYKLQIKVMNDVSNPSHLIENITRNCHNKSNPIIRESLNKYIEFIRSKGTGESIYTRYFLIYEYEGKPSAEWEDIVAEMYQTRQQYINILGACGNLVIEADDIDMQTLEIYYYFFNRKSSRTESVTERIERIAKDYRSFHAETGIKKNISLSDFIAPKGLKFTSRSYAFMDGQYYGFIGFNGAAYPSQVSGLFLQYFKTGADLDYDIILKRIPKQSVSLALSAVNNVTARTVHSKSARNKDVDSLVQKYQMVDYIKKQLKNGQELYDVAVIITVRANTARQLGFRIREIEKDLDIKQMAMDSCFDCVEEYFAMTMPLLYITPPFRRLKHNLLTEALTSFYPFTSYQMTDPNGFVLGTAVENSALSVINLFNYTTYRNANTVIFGSSGAGKTFILQAILTRMFFNGINCYVIAPKKGYEFKRSCSMVNGTYCYMGPDSPNTINIMEIRPEKELDSSMVDEDTSTFQSPLLSKKITVLETWLKLVAKDFSFTTKAMNIINSSLVSLYARFGITKDNNSIWKDKDKNRLKKMPIVQDMYEEFLKHPELEELCEDLTAFISGTYSNFNGQTNIDIHNPYIVFDCDEDYIGERYLSSILYVAYDFCYDKVKGQTSSRSVLAMDEAWKLMANPETAVQVQNAVKLIRGYGGGTIIATQEIEDFMKGGGGEYGASIINNSAIKLILPMEENGLDAIKKYLKLSPEEAELITSFGTITDYHAAMLITGKEKVVLNIEASQYEIEKLKDRTRKIRKHV